MSPPYRGRFAPSPTGPLHFGSLVAAVASYADALAHRGEWLVRIEDVDKPRTVAGATSAILASLETHGFQWDGPVVVQSERDELYRHQFARLQARAAVYPCACSRRHLADGVYPGTCRSGLQGKSPRAWRLRVAGAIAFEDRLTGPHQEDLETATGDFVLLRADGLWAYQLAVVADDAAQGITHVVRGADLLSSTARQIYLQRLLGYPTPAYLHVPLVVDPAGDKLSKQTGAAPLDDSAAAHSLARAAAFLGHPVPPELDGAPPPIFWKWLAHAWRPTRIPGSAAVLPL